MTCLESDQYQSSESETQTESDRQSPSQFIPSPRLDSIRHDSSSPLLRPSPTRASTIRSSPLHQSAERGARRNQNDQDLMERNATETPQVERRLNALEAENRRIAEDSANTIRQLQSDGDGSFLHSFFLLNLGY